MMNKLLTIDTKDILVTYFNVRAGNYLPKILDTIEKIAGFRVHENEIKQSLVYIMPYIEEEFCLVKKLDKNKFEKILIGCLANPQALDRTLGQAVETIGFSNIQMRPMGVYPRR